MDNNLSNRIKNITTRVFTIAGCPEETYQRFTNFCKLNARNVRVKKNRDTGEIISQYEELIYHMGLRILLDIAEADGKNQMLFDRLSAAENNISTISEQISTKKEEPVERKSPMGFGVKKVN
jgi:hypothetical protein